MSSIEDYHKLTSQEVKINGKRIDVHIAKNKDELETEKREISLKRLFVGGVNLGMTDEEFRAFFGKFGELKKGYIIRNTKTHKSKGFGFLDYFDLEVANFVLNKKSFYIKNCLVEIKSLMQKDELFKIRE